HHRDPGPAWAEYGRRVTAGLAAADIVVAPTAALLRGIVSAYGVSLRSRVIPNSCAAPAWRPGTKTPIVLSAGRLWDEAKGLADLVACAPRVAWPIVVAGPTAAPWEPEAARPRGVHLLGALAANQLAAWMARASIYALP